MAIKLTGDDVEPNFQKVAMLKMEQASCPREF